MTSLIDRIKSNPKLKGFIHWMIVPRYEARPRMWIKLFVNPFFHKKGAGSKIRSRTRIDVLPFNKFELGERSTIEDFSTINNGVGDVIIGANSLVGMGNVIIGPVSIGNNVIMAQNIVISGLNHGYQDIDLPIVTQPISKSQIVIEDDCWIGANAVITAGVVIGKHCVVAAGSVVTKSVPSFTVVAGNPARKIKSYDSQIGSWVSSKSVD